ncbi:MAG: OstA-like protein [Bacteroidota bacterium]
MKRFLFTAFIIVLSAGFLIAQEQPKEKKKVELISAVSLRYDKDIPGVKRLIGDVAFKHNGTYMFCDSAYFAENENYIEAYGNIQINQNDTVRIWGKKLIYNGEDRIAELHDSVVMEDGKMTLFTNHLNYDMNAKTAQFYDSGYIFDKENTLESLMGFYYVDKGEFFFKKDVVLTNPKYVMTSDTLLYNTQSKISYFFGPTEIVGKDNYIYCENGWYNTEKEVSQFNKNAFLRDKNQTLEGDSIYYNRTQGFGKGFGNVKISDTIEKTVISGDYGQYDEVKDESFVTGNALLTKVSDGDSMFLHADTLQAYFDTTNQCKSAFAYHNVKMYKSDLQGLCDSLVYNYTDSLIRLYKKPVIWSDKTQLTAEYIELRIKNKDLESALMKDAAFMISEKDTIRYDQVKGKVITGYFSNRELYKLIVEGNGETIYYMDEENKSQLGINKAESSEIVIYFLDQEVNRISFKVMPTAVLYPPDKLSSEEKKLKDFRWLAPIRPKSKADLF